MNAEFNIFEIFLNSATGNKYTISISLCKQVFINLLIIFLEWGNETILMLQSLIHVIEIKSIPGKVFLTFGMGPFLQKKQPPPPPPPPPPPLYSMLENIERVAKPKLVPRTFLRHFQTTLTMGRAWLLSEFM